MSFSRLLPLVLLASLFAMRCERHAQTPAVLAQPNKSTVKVKSQKKTLTTVAQISAFTINDFDSNSTDHKLIREAIARELGKSVADLGQEDLSQVRKLDLFVAGITDISPLAALSGLKRLDILGNRVADLKPLRGLISLEVLYASENKITDLTPLSKLPQLKVLHLRDNYISDITSLAGLQTLVSLDLEQNRVKDLTPLSKMHDLNWLGLGINQVSDDRLNVATDITHLGELRRFHFDERCISQFG